jgi:NADH-quinone oxidoreductase subunit K
VIPLESYLILSAVIFSISFAGVILNRKNIIVLLMCIELMLLSINFNFIAFSQYKSLPAGELFVFFILAVAAAESAVGLAILVLIYRKRKSIDVDGLSMLKG